MDITQYRLVGDVRECDMIGADACVMREILGRLRNRHFRCIHYRIDTV